MRRFINILWNITAVLFIIIIVSTILGVFSRFILNSPLTWSDELSRFSLLWMVFLASVVVTYKDKHLNVDFIFDYISDDWKRILRNLNFLISIIFLILVVFSSFDLLRVASYSTSSALDIPLSYWRGSVVVGLILMVVVMIYKKIELFKKKR
ncbi:TRAP transporter small permease [Nosocomiicoccus ampullae]|uniref:TRAP transporter small permease n=1 Tax=Nosocomiicoccus ampullae TaxID=489910 RepID=UPI001C5F1582|nr:TRAP transporter small permease [Nosocomiicoccus ampullae]QYA49104.1 TRAP transporter small permease [Nosocomiicoccus ampullae]